MRAACNSTVSNSTVSIPSRLFDAASKSRQRPVKTLPDVERAA
ncbi:Uncharacterised protein [Mycobacteroides abscessus subsp. abscessus]|nr:Uncharacterised protein [Mycobacteroides abscessus subsp. abscessus]